MNSFVVEQAFLSIASSWFERPIRGREMRKSSKRKNLISEVFLVSSKLHKMLRLVEDVRTWWMQHIYSQEGIVLELQLKHLFELVSSKEKPAA